LVAEIDTIVRLISQPLKSFLRAGGHGDLALRAIEIKIGLIREFRTSFNAKYFSHGVQIRT
jgi:hypothetical protein